MSGGHHEPVMVEEVLELLSPVPNGTAVDATVGGGGHARSLLEARPDLSLLALDRDERAVDESRRALAPYGDRVQVIHAPFDRLGDVVGGRERERAGDRESVVAVLFDLGVSSHHLDVPDRGFSFRQDGPIDMRMDRSQSLTAADIVNHWEVGELGRVLRDYGEERHAHRIARAIERRRPLRTTGELAEVIETAVPARARRRGHPARRTFQALRIAVNDELGQLERGLDQAAGALAPRGRLVVLSYHSLEDRIVKRRFTEWVSGGQHPRGLPVLETERGGTMRFLTRGAQLPSPAEVERNPRASAARLRAVEMRGEAA